MKQPTKRLRAFDDQLERLGIGARRNLASAGLSVRHGTWTLRTLVMPDGKHPGRDAAPCCTRS
jgi:hypothetical protein